MKKGHHLQNLYQEQSSVTLVKIQLHQGKSTQLLLLRITIPMSVVHASILSKRMKWYRVDRVCVYAMDTAIDHGTDVDVNGKGLLCPFCCV